MITVTAAGSVLLLIGIVVSVLYLRNQKNTVADDKVKLPDVAPEFAPEIVKKPPNEAQVYFN